MSKSTFSQWLRLIWLVLSKGSLTIKPYNYSSHIKRLWKNNSEVIRLEIEHEIANRSWKSYILYLPIIGPLVGMLSSYRQQRKWPTYIYHAEIEKLAFIRISKNAGTSLQATLLKSQYPELDILKLNVNQINEMGKAHIKPYLEVGYECFALVRNPFFRVLSCYFDQVIGREERYYYDDYLFRIIKKGVSFEEFVKTISKIPDELKDIHFRPQSHYIRHINNVQLFKVETDKDALYNYLSKYSLTIETQNKNEVVFDIKEYYTEELKNIVAEVYKEDFEFLGYNPNDFLNTND